MREGVWEEGFVVEVKGGAEKCLGWVTYRHVAHILMPAWCMKSVRLKTRQPLFYNCGWVVRVERWGGGLSFKKKCRHVCSIGWFKKGKPISTAIFT